ncbi:YesL family protein [Domibacillus iocasae]|uniref:DUF624 domain-containing protein n=1 Tax=Domibacillus iocasae TaxID=1714016 RepID=A0A1E7DVC4_9BACI|nr:DUF624 domain-containing protein [Domibacillus iocasae]OES46638.1 hypothetical protein BA724_00845 [Domibacillus iocasae]
MVQDKLQKSLEIFTAFIFLNVLWVLFCLPVLTIYPSTMALFAVIRKWKKEEIDYDIWEVFISSFKENMSRYFWAGLFWLLTGVLLIVDYYLLLTVPLEGKSFMSGLLFLGTFLYIGMTLWIFPVTVNFELMKKETVKNTFLFTAGRMGTTCTIMIIFVCMIIFCYFVPFLLWIAGSLTGFLIYVTISHLNKEIWNGATDVN